VQEDLLRPFFVLEAQLIKPAAAERRVSDLIVLFVFSSGSG
jgi:hypothetical protein